MYYIAICDDDLNFADYIIKLLIGRVGLEEDEVVFYKYGSGEELIKSFDKNIPFDLLILDMQMGKLDGDETAKEFRQRYFSAILVFCSGVRLPTIKSFESDAYRYLIKQYDSNKFTSELKNIINEMKRRKASRSISIEYRNDICFIEPDRILYVGRRKHGCNVYLYDRINKCKQEMLCNKSILELSNELGDFEFASPHNSYFVNLNHIASILKHEIILIDGTVLTISRSKEKMFKDAPAKYLANKY